MGLEVQLNSFSASVLDRGVRSFSHPRGFTLMKDSQYSLNRRLSGLHRPSAYFGEHKNPLPMPGFELRVVQPVDYTFKDHAVFHGPLDS